MKQLNFKDISKIMSCPKPTKPPTDCLYQTAVSDSDSLADGSSKSKFKKHPNNIWAQSSKG